MPPLDRHLWYFKASSAATSAHVPLQDASVDPNDHFLALDDIKQGLERMGVHGTVLDLVSLGVMVDRGARQLLKGQGSLGEMDISSQALWSTAHPVAARSGVFDDQGNVDLQKQAQFLQLLDPQNTGKITMDQFKAAAKTLMKERDPGTSLGAWFKRHHDEGTFDRAWGSFMVVAGHSDASTGLKYVTPNDVKWFFDGSYFYRRAEQLAQK
jgi:hypothetical protein